MTQQSRLNALRADPKAVKWARMAAETYMGRSVTDEWIVGVATGGYIWLLVADTLMGEMGLRRL